MYLPRKVVRERSIEMSLVVYLMLSLPRKSNSTMLSPMVSIRSYNLICSTRNEQQPTVSASSSSFSLPTRRASCNEHEDEGEGGRSASSMYLVNEVECHSALTDTHFFALPINLITVTYRVDNPVELSSFFILLPIAFSLKRNEEEIEASSLEVSRNRNSHTNLDTR